MKRLTLPLTAILLAATPALAQQAGSQLPGEDAYVAYFGFDSADLDGEARVAVEQAAQAYRLNGTGITVRGYTDTAGSSDYNRRLAERRAQTVAEALTQAGVPASAIETLAVGEDNLLVPTPDGDPQQGNRRVEIAVEAPPPPPPAPVAVVEPVPVAPPPPVEYEADAPDEDSGGLFGLTVSPFYAYNLGDGADNDKTSHLAGLNLGTTFGLGTFGSVSLDQAGFYNFMSEDDGFGGRTALGTDFNLGFGDIVPYIGANIGGYYGPGVEDGFFAGPRAGLRLPYFNVKVGYDIPFDRSLDEGYISAILGYSLRF